MDKISIQLAEGSDSVTLRAGEAPAVVELRGFSYTGNIKAVGDWVEGKRANSAEMDLARSTVVVEKESISLTLNEDVPLHKIVIMGRLKSFADLSAFGINNDKTIYTNRSLIRVLKMNRYYFADKEENLLMVSNLSKFKAQVVRELEDSNDLKGNKKVLFEQKVKADLKLSFDLSIPLYQGEDNKNFKVDINFDVNDGGVEYWLESADLRELQLKERSRIIDREVSRLSDFARVSVD